MLGSFSSFQDPRFGDLSSQVEAIKHSLADLQSNVSYLLTSMPREGGNSQPSYTPLRPSVLEVTKGQTYIPQQRTPVGQNSMSTVHHYHYGAANDLFVEDIVSGNANVDKGSIYVHHHNEKEAEKKRKKGCKNNVSYDDDYEFCNIPEHDNVVSSLCDPQGILTFISQSKRLKLLIKSR